MFVTADEVDLLTEALARAASRHESQARSISVLETAKKHSTAAKSMRALRNRIIANLEKKELSEILLRT